MENELDKPAASAALDAAIERNAEVVRRGRRRRPFLERLGLSLPVTPTDVKQAYLEKAKRAHPDHGGDSQAFKELHAAYNEALQFAQRNGKRLPWIGVQMPLYIAQREVVRLVESWGGKVEIQHLDWLEDTVGEDFTAIADRLVEVNLSQCPVGDEEMLAIAAQGDGLKFLEVLRVANTDVGDTGLLKVVATSNLRYLDVRGTRVSDGVREQLAQLPQMNRVEGRRSWGIRSWRNWLPRW